MTIGKNNVGAIEYSMTLNHVWNLAAVHASVGPYIHCRTSTVPNLGIRLVLEIWRKIYDVVASRKQTICTLLNFTNPTKMYYQVLPFYESQQQKFAVLRKVNKPICEPPLKLTRELRKLKLD